MRYTPEMSCLAWESLSKTERERLAQIGDCARRGDTEGTRRAVNDYIVARWRVRRDLEADVKRRVLVGARLSRVTAEAVRTAARSTGRSMYRFVADAVERELERCKQTGSKL